MAEKEFIECEATCEDCVHYGVCYHIEHYGRDIETDEPCEKFKPDADVVEIRHGKIKWVNRPIAAQYATVTDEYGEKHYGKVCDHIENNPVGYCGECGKRLDDTFMNYCPNCGAVMRGERRKEDG